MLSLTGGTTPKKPCLIVAILFKRRGAVGGMAQRFSMLGGELIRRGENIELLTSKSLASEFGLPNSSKVIVLDDTKVQLTLKSWILLLRLIGLIFLGCYRQVHLAGAGRLFLPLQLACRFSRTRLSCTFASRTLDMASYGNPKNRLTWLRILNRVDKIDVLNPGHDLIKWKDKISVSPCSFPSKIRNLPTHFPESKSNVAVFCGAFEKTKNPILALEILDSYVSETGDRITCAFFGKGSLLPHVSKRIGELNAKHGGELAYLGQISKLGETLASATVFLSLQEYDNYPSQAVLEAMLMGCKIIATSDGDTKLLFPKDEPRNAAIASRDSLQFVDAMRIAFADNKASLANFHYVSENHNLDRFADYFIRFLNE
jgi:glycosyltransferase involved in cell wall biosynthesis